VEKTFDVQRWLGLAKEGRDELLSRKRELMQQRNDLDREIQQVDDDIAKIDSVVGPALGNGSGRVTGVLDLTRRVVHEVASTELLAESDLVTEVLRLEPMMKPDSIKSALRTLVTKDEVERAGKRGSHTYRWKTHKDGSVAPSIEDRINTGLANAGQVGVTAEHLIWKTGDSEGTTLLLQTLVDEGSIERFPVGQGEFRYRIVKREEETDDGEPQSTLFQS
jgi:hypothetical protein